MLDKHPLRVSVVVPAYNAADTLPLCLEALARQDFPANDYEVIVVDDGSKDATGALASAAGAQVIRQDNRGPAAARNRGAAAACGELVLFTDADCEPVPGWIASLVSAFADPRVAGAKGTYLTRQTGIVPRFTQLEYEDRYDRMLGVDSIDFIDTYSAAYRRSIFQANHGFDLRFPTASVEDQEFSFRLAEKGYRLVFVPQAQVYHRHNRTLHAYVRRKYLIGYWKALLAHWHPGRMVRDSHTPQSLKLQMLLLAFAAGAAEAGIFWRPALAASGLAAGTFLLSTGSFLRKVWRRDRSLCLPAAGLLAARALALGTGFAIGLVRFRTAGTGVDQPITGTQRAVKRLMDLTVSATGLGLAAVPMAAIAVAIKLDSPGPVIFKQVRVGQNGGLFRIYKFRTMVDGAEKVLPELVDLDALPEPAFKLRDDPRVTRVGRFLRRYSLDELPQLWNVLRGQMSLVGPRPEEVCMVERYTDNARRRLVIKPGLTGPMQVNGRGDLAFERRLALELDYIDNYSLRRDLQILLQTFPAVLGARGAY